MLATNTIAEGDSREVGLATLSSSGVTLVRAEKSRKWPGTANLEIASLWLRKGDWQGSFCLGNEQVGGITPYLEIAGIVTGEPCDLSANDEKCIEGAKALGMGFTLEPDEAESLMNLNPRNEEVLFPFLTGQDLNSTSDQSASRWTIYFADWPLSREMAPVQYRGPVAKDYPESLRIIEERVKPERFSYPPDSSWNRSIRAKWWQYGLLRPALLKAMEGMKRVLMRSAVSNQLICLLSNDNSVFSCYQGVFISRLWQLCLAPIFRSHDLA